MFVRRYLACGYCRIRVFNFAALIIIRIVPPECFRGVERVLEFAVGNHPVWVKVAEIVVPAGVVLRAVCAAAERCIRKQPAVGGNVELRPVMVANVLGRGIKPALPLGGYARAAAQRYEQQRLNAAVSLQVARAAAMLSRQKYSGMKEYITFVVTKS